MKKFLLKIGIRIPIKFIRKWCWWKLVSPIIRIEVNPEVRKQFLSNQNLYRKFSNDSK